MLDYTKVMVGQRVIHCTHEGSCKKKKYPLINFKDKFLKFGYCCFVKCLFKISNSNPLLRSQNMLKPNFIHKCISKSVCVCLFVVCV